MALVRIANSQPAHHNGLVRITLKKAYAGGTVAVDMDPLSLLCRLATSVPPPRLHTVRYAGVLAAARVRVDTRTALVVPTLSLKSEER